MFKFLRFLQKKSVYTSLSILLILIMLFAPTGVLKNYKGFKGMVEFSGVIGHEIGKGYFALKKIFVYKVYGEEALLRLIAESEKEDIKDGKEE